jgi:hypothetical protein
MSHQSEIKAFKRVIGDTKQIIKHHNEITVARGEYFNLFSVLNIETKENKTHSAFLTELLNPNGSHKMGTVFLELFLQVVKPKILHENEEVSKGKFPTKVFDTSKVFVKAEKSIGPLNLCEKEGEDDANASGGRIDIFLKDNNGIIICIENKIHAIDQPKQIQRYYNYKTVNNTVFYLTLLGEDPNGKSSLALKSGLDFYNISYRDDITRWLELCLKEVPNFTGLRESINQYILLIKKLTNTLDTKHEKELAEIMLNNMVESEYISNNYQRVLNTIRKNFRTAIANDLSDNLDNEKFEVIIGDAIEKKYAQIWIHIKGTKNDQLCFGVETFSGLAINHGDLFVGILDTENTSSDFKVLKDFNTLNAWWPHHKKLLTVDENTFDLRDHSIIKLIRDKESDSCKKLIATCVDQIIEFVNTNTEYVTKHLMYTK